MFVGKCEIFDFRIADVTGRNRQAPGTTRRAAANFKLGIAKKQ